MIVAERGTEPRRVEALDVAGAKLELVRQVRCEGSPLDLAQATHIVALGAESPYEVSVGT